MLRMRHKAIQASLYNLNGKLINSSINNSQFNINLIPTGTYLLEIQDLYTGQKIVEKIVIGN